MSLPAWFGSRLPCGCVCGVRLCAEAEALWDAVADAHKDVASAWGDQRLGIPVNLDRVKVPYEAALAAFSAHVEIEAEPAVQGAML